MHGRVVMRRSVVEMAQTVGSNTVAEVELNDAVTPAGNPDAARFTLPVKPFAGTTVIVLFPLFPCMTARLDGDAEREKSGVLPPPPLLLLPPPPFAQPAIPASIRAIAAISIARARPR